MSSQIPPVTADSAGGAETLFKRARTTETTLSRSVKPPLMRSGAAVQFDFSSISNHPPTVSTPTANPLRRSGPALKLVTSSMSIGSNPTLIPSSLERCGQAVQLPSSSMLNGSSTTPRSNPLRRSGPAARVPTPFISNASTLTSTPTPLRRSGSGDEPQPVTTSDPTTLVRSRKLALKTPAIRLPAGHPPQRREAPPGKDQGTDKTEQQAINKSAVSSSTVASPALRAARARGSTPSSSAQLEMPPMKAPAIQYPAGCPPRRRKASPAEDQLTDNEEDAIGDGPSTGVGPRPLQLARTLSATDGELVGALGATNLPHGRGIAMKTPFNGASYQARMARSSPLAHPYDNPRVPCAGRRVAHSSWKTYDGRWGENVSECQKYLVSRKNPFAAGRRGEKKKPGLRVLFFEHLALKKLKALNQPSQTADVAMDSPALEMEVKEVSSVGSKRRASDQPEGEPPTKKQKDPQQIENENIARKVLVALKLALNLAPKKSRKTVKRVEWKYTGDPWAYLAGARLGLAKKKIEYEHDIIQIFSLSRPFEKWAHPSRVSNSLRAIAEDCGRTEGWLKKTKPKSRAWQVPPVVAARVRSTLKA